MRRPAESALDAVFASPWIAYPALLLLQLKVVWGMWLKRDLTGGDTSSYFTGAWLWYESRSNVLGWSPLYTAFYGSFLHLSRDAFVVTMAHRLVLVFALAVLVLAWMRRMLPAPLAWLVAAWWAVLPITFDALYEVHLFAVLPILLGGLAIVSGDAPWRRGAALAVLLLATVLVRNETAIATGIVAAFVATAEARQLRASGSRPELARRLRQRVIGYGLPILVAGLVVLFFYTRSTVKYPALRGLLAGKHVTNVCQIYAFGYKQRHTDWRGSPWTECAELMRRDFGAPGPTMGEAIRLNPRAMLEHFGWNALLIPNGLQVLLFDATWGSANPDYAPVRTGSHLALALSAVLLATLGTGAAVLWRDRRFWWGFWLRDRIWGWIYLLAVDATAAVVMLMQRPRPSYLFAFGLSVMTAAGMAAFALVRRWRMLPALAAAAALLLLVLAPTYSPKYGTERRGLLRAYRRLAPFTAVFEKPGVVFVSPYNAAELCFYLGHRSSYVCRSMSDAALAAGDPAALADDLGVNLVYADGAFPASSRIADLLERAGRWNVLGAGEDGGNRWALLARAPAAESTR